MKLHVNPPQGMRIEDSEQYFARWRRRFAGHSGRRSGADPRQHRPANSGINLAFGNSSTISNSDGDILIALKPGKKDTQKYMRAARRPAQKFPDGDFFFTPANMTNQILDFGLPAPIDLQVIGRGKDNYELAQKLDEADRGDSRRGGRAHASAGRTRRCR
jgi:hypothetical protein